MKTKILLGLGIFGLVAGFFLLDPFSMYQRNIVSQLSLQQIEPGFLGVSLAPLSAAQWEQFEEISAFSSKATKNPVLSIASDWGRGHLLTIDTAGVLRRWDMEMQSLINESALNLDLEPGSISFSADGSYLLAPIGRHETQLLDYTLSSGIMLVDTHNGDVLRCYGMPCNFGQDYQLLTRGSLLTPDAGYVFYYLEDGFAYFNPGLNASTKQHDGGKGYQQAGTGFTTVNRIALDPQGDYLALTFDTGGLVIERLDLDREDSLGLNWGESTWISEGSWGAPNTTQALAFDDTRTWLARLSRDHLSVWDLRSGQSASALDFNIEGGQVLTFERNGHYLMVGTQIGLQVYHLESGTMIDEWPLGPISALYLTPDNRLLLWGDDQGVVHAWGMPE